MPPSKPVVRHPSSLLNLSLVEHLFEDSTVRLARRGVDARWTYEGEIQTNQSGFNPAGGTIFYRAHSHLERWLPHKDEDTRDYNHDDDLISEAMFAVHDHLHIWAYRWIQALRPEIGLGTAAITRSNLEALTFCHLLTEAIATVGLDYWFLCTMDLNEVLNIGTDYTCATLSYKASLEDEYRRFHPTFSAQRPEHLALITKFYCTGEFLGFGKEDLARSPLLLSWLSHELKYGVRQREYTRSWLSYLAHEDLALTPAKLKARVATGARWQKRLVGQLTDLLWSKVKNGKAERPPHNIDPRTSWGVPRHKPVDFRFASWNVLQTRRGLGRLNLNLSDSDNFCFWFRQFVSSYNFEALAPELLAFKLELFHKGRRDLCEYFFRDAKRVARHRREQEMLFLLN
ncbi:MAG: hypothetical protein ACI9OJ_005365 [Myxococcota bacterium]|jgi:hypothetical protein